MLKSKEDFKADNLSFIRRVAIQAGLQEKNREKEIQTFKEGVLNPFSIIHR